MGTSFCIYTHVFTISKDIGINEEKEICPLTKESISAHKCERTNMAAKHEMYMNGSKNFLGICKNKNGCQTKNI